jgi:mannosyltransferase
VFLVILASYFFVAEFERPSLRNRVWYVVVSVAAMYAHYFAGLILAAHAATLLITQGPRVLTGKWAWVGLAIALPSAPAIVLALDFGPIAAASWITAPTRGDVANAQLAFAGRSSFVLAVLVGAGIVGTLRTRGTPGQWRSAFLWSWFLLPNLLCLLLSIWYPFYISYYLIGCLPGLLLLGVSGLAQIRSTPLFAAAGSILLLAAASRLPRQYRAPGHEDWRGATRHVLEGARPGDGVVFVPDFGRKPFNYYVRRSGRPGPDNITRDRSWDRDRIWLVTREADRAGRRLEFERAADSLAAGRRIGARQDFRGVRATLYAR